MEAAFKGNTTKTETRERLRKERQDELGVCLIRRIAEDQRSQTLGSGFVVKDLQIFPGFTFSYCLISSEKVFPKDDCNIESYVLDFKKLESTDLKTVELKHVAAKSTDFIRTSGLVLIPINPSKKCKNDQSIFTYRPFKVANVGIAPSEDLKCCFVDDDSGKTNFAFVTLQLKRSETVSTRYQLHEVNEPPYTKYDDIIDRGDHRKPYGAVILKPSKKEFIAVGALTFTDDECRNICCEFFPLHVPLDTQTSEPFSEGSEHPVLDGKQQVSVESAPSIEIESPGVASTGTDTFKEGKPSDVELDDLALQIDAKWKRMGIRLGISNDVLEGIDANTEAEERPFQMLLHWRNKTTSATPYCDIYNALCHSRVGLNNIAKEFCCEQRLRSSLKRDLPYPSEHHPSAALDVRIDVDSLKLKEHNTQDRTVSAIESEGSRDGEQQAASAVPGSVLMTCAGDEAHQTPNPILTKEDVLCLIAANYLQNSPPKCKADRDDFMAYMKEMRLVITGVRIGSLLITVKCDSLQILERLWEDFSCGHLGEVVQRCFVTEEILTELSLAELKLKTTISEEEYKACKKYLGKDPGREADETDDDDDSASEDEGQCGNVAVPDEQPIHVHFLDEEHLFQRREDDDDQTERVEEKLKTGTDEGSSVSEDEEADDGDDSVSDDEDQCGNVTIPVEQPSRVHFADEENVRDKEDNLQTEIVEEELKTGTDEGSLVSKDEDQFTSVPAVLENTTRLTGKRFLKERDDISSDSGISSSASSSSNKSSSRSTRQPSLYRGWNYQLHQLVITGLEEFGVGSPKELQDYLTYLAREMDSAGLLRTRGSVLDKPPSAWEHLSKKGDLTSRTPEEQPYRKEEKTPAVVMQKTSKPGLLRRKEEKTPGVIMQKTSKLVQESPSVKHFRDTMDDKQFREFVTAHVQQGAWQVVMLFLDELLHRDSKDDDEDTVSGDLKSRKLTWWPTHEDHDLTILLKVLTKGKRKLTDEGAKHIAEALTSSHCRLESLDLGWNELTDEGVKHIAEALSSSHCRLESLDLRGNKVTDEGVKHIAEALSSSHCRLERLRLGGNKVTDEGVKHIAEALSNTYCRLNVLFLSGNDNITNKGLTLLAKALVHSNYELEAKRPFIVVRAKVKGRMSEESLS